jgi:hypothetical protein
LTGAKHTLYLPEYKKEFFPYLSPEKQKGVTDMVLKTEDCEEVLFYWRGHLIFG